MSVLLDILVCEKSMIRSRSAVTLMAPAAMSTRPAATSSSIWSNVMRRHSIGRPRIVPMLSTIMTVGPMGFAAESLNITKGGVSFVATTSGSAATADHQTAG